jgi:hypothetical protein
VEEPERKRPLGEPRHRWVDNIGLGGVAQDRDKRRGLVNAVMHEKPSIGYTTVGLSSSAQLHRVSFNFI